MSTLQGTQINQIEAKRTGRKGDFGFIAILVCMALGLAGFAAVLTPTPSSGEISNNAYVGP